MVVVAAAGHAFVDQGVVRQAGGAEQLARPVGAARPPPSSPSAPAAPASPSRRRTGPWSSPAAHSIVSSGLPIKSTGPRIDSESEVPPPPAPAAASTHAGAPVLIKHSLNSDKRGVMRRRLGEIDLAEECIAQDEGAVGVHLAAVGDDLGRRGAGRDDLEATRADGDPGIVLAAAAVLHEQAVGKVTGSFRRRPDSPRGRGPRLVPTSASRPAKSTLALSWSSRLWLPAQILSEVSVSSPDGRSSAALTIAIPPPFVVLIWMKSPALIARLSVAEAPLNSTRPSISTEASVLTTTWLTAGLKRGCRRYPRYGR